MEETKIEQARRIVREVDRWTETGEMPEGGSEALNWSLARVDAARAFLASEGAATPVAPPPFRERSRFDNPWEA